MEDLEDKFSAGTLNDVLIDVPETLHFVDLIPHILAQLRLNKDDTFIVKGGYKIIWSAILDFLAIKVNHACLEINNFLYESRFTKATDVFFFLKSEEIASI